MDPIPLQSKDYRELLDVIDKLRSKGIGRYVDLPEIIVCGDQSAGKSSVLEAISGMSFPTKDNLCTRFPTELVLRRAPKAIVKVSINADAERSAEERERLSRFCYEDDAASLDLGLVTEKAKEEMGLSQTKVFCTDALHVELCGPTQPHLTLVDLPGLFHAGNTDQSETDAATVGDMVQSYMNRPRSIILAVVSAKNDFNLQAVTKIARKLDPKGVRTMGIITKPDTLDLGSDSEMAYIKLAQNRDVVFRLGWHVLINRDYARRNTSNAERDEFEEQFFMSGSWQSVDPMSLGVKSLRPRLSNVLKEQILRQLPHLLQDVKSGIDDCQSRLQRLGTERQTFETQRRYLLQVSRKFSTLMTAAVDGFYKDAFFGSAKTESGYQNRLRAVVQNTLTKFKDEMQAKGQMRTIVEALPNQGPLGDGEVLRSQYIEEVKDLVRKSRGCELPGTFNPLIIGELFSEQCQPWEGIAAAAKDSVMEAVYRTVRAILGHVAVAETAGGIVQLIGRGLDDLRTVMDQQIRSLLAPHLHGHPITYNQSLLDNVQEVQDKRRRAGLEKVLVKLFGSKGPLQKFDEIVSPLALLDLLVEHEKVDMESYASELAVDYMQAYYKVCETPGRLE